MKEQTKKNLKTAAKIMSVALGTTYLIMRHIAKKQYPDSVYANQPEEQNPVQGRKVVFIECFLCRPESRCCSKCC